MNASMNSQSWTQLNTHAIAEPSHAPVPYQMLDTEFITALGDLIQCFEQLASDHKKPKKLTARAFETLVANDEYVNEELHRLAFHTLGSPHWTRMLDWAAACADPRLLEYCRNFLQRILRWTTQYGVCTWLYVLINDAEVAKMMQQPTEDMPILGPITGRRVVQWLYGTGIERYGKADLLHTMMQDYADETYRIAAYCCLTWGVNDARSVDMASALLLHHDIGRPMLRDSSRSEAFLGEAPQLHHREALDYMQVLRTEADLDYACDLQMQLDEDQQLYEKFKIQERLEETNERKQQWLKEMWLADRRYLFDARHVIEAYRMLWNQQTPTVDHILNLIRDELEPPKLPAWQNPVYLNDLAGSLVGSFHAEMMREAFEHRDRERFENAVAWITEHCELVEHAGFFSLPISMVVRCEMQEVQSLGESVQQREVWDYWMMQMADNMAAVLLARIADPAQARKAARALMVHDLDSHLDALEARVSDCRDFRP
ncbi:riboflavin deaminase [Bifidobacterium dolichotidis]|uniref:Riboflavin deaminase n=1 Tax=Bifidobacterium dolichotidis TaxID=2306976 RepID=A0A430FKX4_9BIFI|nr:hypothetical protein [Bifidobacterium dolichotidis]RSX53358.1 riboflavin deaminase [Bifidobacterium dolichotidis]